MESRNGDQGWRYIGAPQWHSYAGPRSQQAPIQYGQGSLTEPRFIPEIYTVLSGHPNTQQPFHGSSRITMDAEREMPRLPAPYQQTHVEGVYGLETSGILDRGTFSTCLPVGPLLFRNMNQDSGIEGPLDRSLEPWMWPQGDLPGQQAYSFGSDSFRNSDNGPTWQPDDQNSTPTGPCWTDHSFPRTPSPGSGNHDSPGLPGTPFRQRMNDFVADEDPLVPGMTTWSLDIPFTHRNGHTQARRETGPTTQPYYPYVAENGIVVPHYPPATPRKPKENRRGQKKGQKGLRSKRGKNAPKTPVNRNNLERTQSHRNTPGEFHGPNYSIFDLNMEQKDKRPRRRFSKGEKERMKALRKLGACDKCHEKHRKCVHVIPEAIDEGLSEEPSPASNSEAADQGQLEEPSPASNSEAITPASGGDYVDFTLFPSSSSEDTDMEFEARAFFGDEVMMPDPQCL